MWSLVTSVRVVIGDIGTCGYLNSNSPLHGALGRAVEHWTSDHWVLGSKPGVFKSVELSSFISLPGARCVAHKTLAAKERQEVWLKKNIRNSSVLIFLSTCCWVLKFKYDNNCLWSLGQ